MKFNDLALQYEKNEHILNENTQKLLTLSLPQLQICDITNNIRRVLSHMCDTIYMCVNELKLRFLDSRFL